MSAPAYIREELGFVAVWRRKKDPRSWELSLSKPVADGEHARPYTFINIITTPSPLHLADAKEFLRAFAEAIAEGERLEAEWNK